MMEKYKGAAYRSQYLQSLFRHDMQGADHQAFIGYLLEQVKAQGERIDRLESMLLELAATPTKPAPQPQPEPAKPQAKPTMAPVASPAKPAIQPKPEPGKAAKVAAGPRSEFDTEDLKHIVIDLDE